MIIYFHYMRTVKDKGSAHCRMKIHLQRYSEIATHNSCEDDFTAS